MDKLIQVWTYLRKISAGGWSMILGTALMLNGLTNAFAVYFDIQVMPGQEFISTILGALFFIIGLGFMWYKKAKEADTRRCAPPENPDPPEEV